MSTFLRLDDLIPCSCMGCNAGRGGTQKKMKPNYFKEKKRPITLTGATSSHIQGTTDVRLDPQLNKKVWEQGIKGVPYRLRVRISRRRNDEEDAKEKLYSYVQAVNVKNPKGLVTVVAGAASFFIIQDFPEDAKFLTEEERTFVVRRLQEDDQYSAGGENLRFKYIIESVLDWKTWVGSKTHHSLH